MGILDWLIGDTRDYGGSKSLAESDLRFPSPNWSWLMPQPVTDVRIRDAVGDGSSNSVVEASLAVLETAFCEPTLQVYYETKGGYEVQRGHALTRLLDKPNPAMSGELMFRHLIRSLHVDGNAYWLKVRNARRQVIQLWPVDPRLVEPRWPGDGSAWISHYDYAPGGRFSWGNPIKLELTDVVHFRLNMDRENPRKGYPPLRSVLREVFTDEEAARYTSAVLANMGVPSLLIRPKEGTAQPSQEDLDRVKQNFMVKFGGDRRGEPLALASTWEVTPLSFSPQDMDLAALRRIPEERVTAVLGVPAILAGMGAGLDSATYSNARTLREFFTEQKLVPLWRQVAGEMNDALGSDFGLPAGAYAAFDLSQVRALQDDQNELAARLLSGVTGGAVQVAEYRAALGLEVRTQDRVFLRSFSVVPVPADTSDNPPPALPPAKGRKSRRAAARRMAEAHARYVAAADAAWTPRVRALFDEELQAVLSRLPAGKGRKASISADDLYDPEQARPLWLRLLMPLYDASGQAATDAIVGVQGLDIAWDVSNPDLARFVEGIARRPTGAVTSVPESTRDAIRDVVAKAQQEGYSIYQLTEGAPEDGFPGIRGVFKEASEYRAQMIARTEAATSHNLASAYQYKQAGVQQVEVFDGDEDEECASVDGTVQTVDWANDNPIAHPHCVRAFAAVVD